jgi:hypothetical protein
MRTNKKIHNRRKWKKLFLSFPLKLIKNNQSTYEREAKRKEKECLALQRRAAFLGLKLVPAA